MTLSVRAPTSDDRWMLLEWRNADRVREVSTTDRPIEKAEHEAWYDRLLSERVNEVLVVEWADSPVGVVQLEGLDRGDRTSSWGCHLGRFDSHPALGAALPLLGLGLGFGRFDLRRLTAVVLDSNRNMRSIHRRYRIPLEGTRRAAVMRSDGSTVDVHEYGVLASEWAEILNNGLSLLPSAVRSGARSAIDAF